VIAEKKTDTRTFIETVQHLLSTCVSSFREQMSTMPHSEISSILMCIHLHITMRRNRRLLIFYNGVAKLGAIEGHFNVYKFLIQSSRFWRDQEAAGGASFGSTSQLEE